MFLQMQVAIQVGRDAGGYLCAVLFVIINAAASRSSRAAREEEAMGYMID